jgi:hypothetical protein
MRAGLAPETQNFNPCTQKHVSTGTPTENKTCQFSLVPRQFWCNSPSSLALTMQCFHKRAVPELISFIGSHVPNRIFLEPMFFRQFDVFREESAGRMIVYNK